MRKCGSCGYLLLGEGDSCAHCGAPIAVVTAGAPAGPTPTPTPAPTPAPTGSWPPVPAPALPTPPPGPAPQAPSYGRLTIPPPGGPGVPVGSAPPPPTPALRESWQPIAMPEPPPAPSRSKPIAMLALIVAIALIAGAALVHLRSDPLPPGTSGFVSGGGVTYTSPDGAFQVQLPMTPTVDRQPITVSSVSTTIYLASAATDNYVIFGASAVLPIRVPQSRVSEALDEIAAQGASRLHAKVSHRSLTTHGVLPAIEASLTSSDGYKAHLLVVVSGGTLILLLVAAKTGTDRLFKALDDSLVIR